MPVRQDVGAGPPYSVLWVTGPGSVTVAEVRPPQSTEPTRPGTRLSMRCNEDYLASSLLFRPHADPDSGTPTQGRDCISMQVTSFGACSGRVWTSPILQGFS